MDNDNEIKKSDGSEVQAPAATEQAQQVPAQAQPELKGKEKS